MWRKDSLLSRKPRLTIACTECAKRLPGECYIHLGKIEQAIVPLAAVRLINRWYDIVERGLTLRAPEPREFVSGS